MEDQAATARRPKRTMPDAEAAHLRTAYAGAGVILEYGAGGSTVMAAEMPEKRVFSVESDGKWLTGMQRYFDAVPPLCQVVLHHANIGPTKAWGYPVDEKFCRRWPGYAHSVWELPNFPHPDVVLIDGRFRLACFLTTLLRITRPTTVLVDDYLDRPDYHEAETLQKPVAMIGRMARFELVPQTLPTDRLGWFARSFMRPM